MSKKNRSEVRKGKTTFDGDVIFMQSSQTCRLFQNMDIIDHSIRVINNPDILRHLKVKGAKAILEVLFSTYLCHRGYQKITSSISFDYGHKLFLSYANVDNPQDLLNNKDHKKRFKEFLCHQKFGLCVYFYQDMIILKPDDVDYKNV